MLGECANVRMCKCANAWEMCKCENVQMCKLSPFFAAFVDSLVNAEIGVRIHECKSTYT